MGSWQALALLPFARVFGSPSVWRSMGHSNHMGGDVVGYPSALVLPHLALDQVRAADRPVSVSRSELTVLPGLSGYFTNTCLSAIGPSDAMISRERPQEGGSLRAAMTKGG